MIYFILGILFIGVALTVRRYRRRAAEANEYKYIPVEDRLPCGCREHKCPNDPQ